MNTVEKFFLETMDKCNFRNCVDDDFSFIDHLIDSDDIEKIRERDEAEEKAKDTADFDNIGV